ncbi:tRNA-dependent cyclodipeptide synthase [Streptomyces sp. NPDC014894]|uniref:tRNA-dependent cyclodipeptide synthase n=1 Tax=Streptomyces sp. NPDC014894 TaxID=3364931 RepID=UPI0036F6C2BC
MSIPVGFTVEPCTPESALLVDEAEHALIGLSPWNAYYKPRTVEALVDWACEHFKKVDFVIPGYEAVHTLTAAGYGVADAVHRTRRAVKQLRNPVRRALLRRGADDPEHRVHTWTALTARPAYAAARRRAETAYREDAAVRRACRETASGAVRHAGGGTEPTEAQIDRAVGYAIAELPLVVEGPEVFGVTSSVCVYHRRMDLLEPFIQGETAAFRPSTGQGYAVVRRIENPGSAS